jgi:hypothetical protein
MKRKKEDYTPHVYNFFPQPSVSLPLERQLSPPLFNNKRIGNTPPPFFFLLK